MSLMSAQSSHSSLLQRIGHKREHLLVLIKQQHDSQVSQTLITETWRRDELETFDLSKVCRVAQHVDIQQLCNVIVPCKRVFLLERGLELVLHCDGPTRIAADSFWITERSSARVWMLEQLSFRIPCTSGFP